MDEMRCLPAIRIRYDDADSVPIITQEVTAYLTMNPHIVKGKRPIRVHLREIKEDHLLIRVEAHSSVKKKEAFLASQQEVLLGIFNIVKQYSKGPAWPVVNTIKEDSRPWLETAEDASGSPAPAR